MASGNPSSPLPPLPPELLGEIGPAQWSALAPVLLRWHRAEVERQIAAGRLVRSTDPRREQWAADLGLAPARVGGRHG